MKKDSTRTGATLCSSMRPRSATTLWLKFKLLAFAFMALLSINQVWGADVTVAGWGKVSMSANTSYNASSYQGTTAPKMSSTKAFTTSGGDYCYYGSSSGGAVITISGLPTGFKIKQITFYARASQKGNMAVTYSTDGSSYTSAGSASLTTSVAQKTVTFTSQPTGVTNIKLSHDKTSGSLYFGTVVVTGEAAASKKTVNYSGQKSGHFQPSFLAHSQIVIWGFFAFFCKKVFHIR